MKYQIVLLLSFLCINIIHPQNKKQLDFINNEITKSISYLNLKYDNCYEIISQRKIIHFDLWDNKKEDYLVIYKIRYNSEKGEYYQYLAKFFDSIRDKLSFTNSVSLYSNKIENAKIKLLSTNSYLFTIGITNNGNTDSIVFNYGSQQSTLSAKWNNQIELPELNDAWWFWEEGFKSFRIGEKVEVGYFQYQVKNVLFSKDINYSFHNLHTSGYYLLIEFSITNLSKETQNIFNSMFSLEDDSDYKFEVSHDANAALALQNKNVVMYESLSPKIEKDYIIPFEVPTKNAFYYFNVSGGLGTGITRRILLLK